MIRTLALIGLLPLAACLDTLTAKGEFPNGGGFETAVSSFANNRAFTADYARTANGAVSFRISRNVDPSMELSNKLADLALNALSLRAIPRAAPAPADPFAGSPDPFAPTAAPAGYRWQLVPEQVEVRQAGPVPLAPWAGEVATAPSYRILSPGEPAAY